MPGPGASHQQPLPHLEEEQSVGLGSQMEQHKPIPLPATPRGRMLQQAPGVPPAQLLQGLQPTTPSPDRQGTGSRECLPRAPPVVPVVAELWETPRKRPSHRSIPRRPSSNSFGTPWPLCHACANSKLAASTAGSASAASEQVDRVLASVSDDLRPLVSWLDTRLASMDAQLGFLQASAPLSSIGSMASNCYSFADRTRASPGAPGLKQWSFDDTSGGGSGILPKHSLRQCYGGSTPAVIRATGDEVVKGSSTATDLALGNSKCVQGLDVEAVMAGAAALANSGTSHPVTSPGRSEVSPYPSEYQSRDTQAPTASFGAPKKGREQSQLSQASGGHSSNGSALRLSSIEGSKNSSRPYREKLATAKLLSLGSRVSIEDSQTASQRLLTYLNSRKRTFVADLIWSLLQDEESPLAKFRGRTVTFLLLLSVLLPLLQSIEHLNLPSLLCAVLDTTIDSAFLIDVLIRFLVCPSWRNFLRDPYNVVDFVSGLPLVLRVWVGFRIYVPCDMVQCKLLLGVTPLLRLLRVMRRMEEVHLLYKAWILAFEALPVLLLNYFIIILTASAVIFVVEPPENVNSLSEAAWLTLVSVTTVGYGDTMPSNNYGRAVHFVTVVASSLYMSIPLGIIGNAFSDVWVHRGHLLLKRKARESLALAGLTAKEIPKLFKMFDTDRNGTLDEDEFDWMFQVMKLGLNEERRQQLFSLFDDDHSGAISDKEFVRHLFPESYRDLYGQAPPSVEAVEVIARQRSSISQSGLATASYGHSRTMSPSNNPTLNKMLS